MRIWTPSFFVFFGNNAGKPCDDSSNTNCIISRMLELLKKSVRGFYARSSDALYYIINDYSLCAQVVEEQQ